MASPALLSVAKRIPSIRRQLIASTSQLSIRPFSEAAPKRIKESGKEDDVVAPSSSSSSPQDFVKVKLEPGEWDYDHKDPIDRPPWKSNAKIISAEDFANRPQVGWGDEFEKLGDAMVTLSWLDQSQTDAIYQMYLDMMGAMHQKEGTTSHEYVMRVVAQKYNISARRVAAIVQLAHNEDQIKKEGGKLHYDMADEVDEQIKDHIKNAYEAYGETPPKSFVEDPSGVAEIGSGAEKQSFGSARVEDLYDVDDLMSQTLVRERQEARLAIDSHIYVEDVDDSLTTVPIDANCKVLLKRENEETSFSERSSDLEPLPKDGVKKERFKYVAQIIDTRQEKKSGKKKKKSRRRQDEVEGNTLVEQGGKLRVATVAEVKATSWKPERNIKEFTYAGVKQAWVDRIAHSKTGTWGRFEDKRKHEEELAADEDSSDGSSSSDSEGDSSDSSDEEKEPEDSVEEEEGDDKDSKKKD